MTITVKHPFVSAIADDPAAVAQGEVVPSAWDAAHTVTSSLLVAALFTFNASGLPVDLAAPGGTTQFLRGDLTWQVPPVTPPGGATGTLQYNAGGGNFGGATGTTWDNVNQTLTIAGATLTANDPVLQISQTWNNAGVTFTGLDFNIINTASNGGSNLFNFRDNSGNILRLTQTGILFLAEGPGGGTIQLNAGCLLRWNLGADSAFAGFGNGRFAFSNLASSTSFPFNQQVNNALVFGDLDTASPVAQTLAVQSVATGTPNTAGVEWDFFGSRSTGNAAGGDIVFKTTYVPGASGSTQNPQKEALRIRGTSSSLNACEFWLGADSGGGAVVLTMFGNLFELDVGGNHDIQLPSFYIFRSAAGGGNYVGNTQNNGAWPGITAGGNAGALDIRNNGNNHAHGLRVYNTYDTSVTIGTDPTNYERAVFDWLTTTNTLTIGTQAGGTGVTTRAINFVAGSATILSAAAGANPLVTVGTFGGGTVVQGGLKVVSSGPVNTTSLSWDSGGINGTISTGTWGWTSSSLDSSGALDTAFSRIAPAVAALGSGASGNTSGFLQWGGELRCTADVTNTTTTLATATGLSVALTAGRTYSFTIELQFTDAAAGGIQCALVATGGLTATNIIYSGYTIDSAANGVKGNTQATALGTVVASTVTTGTAGVVRITGTITVNVAGTLNVQFAQNTSNATATTIKRGSYMWIHDMP